MNNSDQVRDFYKEEAEYEKTTLIVKEIINKIISLKQEVLEEKIKHIDNEFKYNDFFNMLNAVIGRKTNKYYFCENEDDVKYYALELGKVYKVDAMNNDIQVRCNEEKVMNLKARVLLAQDLLTMTQELKKLFSLNIGKSDGSLATLDSYIITEQDVEYLDNLIKYLETMLDKTGRLKILSIERDLFALEQARKDYNKKSCIERWFYKKINKENTVIENIATKIKEKK